MQFRRLPGYRGRCLCWADAAQRKRLRKLRDTPHGWWDPPLPAELTTPRPRPKLTVTALDACGNVTPGYAGTVHFSSSDNKATLPANYTFTVGDQGVHTFVNKTTLRTRGTKTVSVTDTPFSASTMQQRPCAMPRRSTPSVESGVLLVRSTPAVLATSPRMPARSRTAPAGWR